MDPSKLFRAVNEGRPADLAGLLSQPCDIESRDKDGNTLLHVASKLGDCKCLEILIQHGAQVDSRDTWASWSPLHHAVWIGRRTAAQLLLSSGADKNARDKEGQTPLHLAAMRGRLLEALLLLDYGALQDLRDQKLFTPLHCAVAFGTVEILYILLQHGADKSLRNKDGKTPAQIAEASKRTDMLALLSRSRPSTSSAPAESSSGLDLASQSETIRKAAVNIFRAQGELGALKAADKLRRLEESMHKAVAEVAGLQKLLEDREEKLKSACLKEAAANKKAAEEEIARREADSRRRTLEKQMADAMHTLSECEQQRADMEKQLKLEVTVREMTEARSLEAETRRNTAEARMNAEIRARQEIEAKLKEKQEWYKQISTQLTEAEKARQEGHSKFLILERQKMVLEDQLKQLINQKTAVEENLKEEQDRRQKAEEKIRKAEAYAKEEQRLRKEEEKARKQVQALVAEEGKLRSNAEAKALDESKRRARAEIKSMAEESKRAELEEQLEAKERKLENLFQELEEMRMLKNISSVPAEAIVCSSKEHGDAVMKLMDTKDDTSSPEKLENTSANSSGVISGDTNRSVQPFPSSQCVAAFERILESSMLEGPIPLDQISSFVDSLRSVAPSQAHVWTKVFQILQTDGDSAPDVEELRKERDALKATLKDMGEKMSSLGAVSMDGVPPLTSSDINCADQLTKKLQQLESDLKESHRRKEEAETRCKALEQILSSGPAAKIAAAARANKPEAKPTMASVLEKFSFRAKVHDISDTKQH